MEPYNISGRRDGTVEVAPKGSAKFGIRAKSIDRLKSALRDYKYDVDEAVRQARRDIITGSFSLEEKQRRSKIFILKHINRAKGLKIFIFPRR